MTISGRTSPLDENRAAGAAGKEQQCPVRECSRSVLSSEVPEGLPANIRTKRIDEAVARFTGAVVGQAASTFPWAHRVQSRVRWSYVWRDWSEQIDLPASDKNTVQTSTTPDEEAAIVESD